MKKSFLTYEKLLEIEKEYETPFHIYDEKGIIDNAKELLEAFSWNKGFYEFFAVKATPNPHILKILDGLGIGADCSSYAELKMCEKAGIKNIMFSSNETELEEYKYASKLGAIINLDDITHIDYIKDEIKIPEKMCLRYNPGGVFKLGNDIMDNPKDAKYGMTKDQIIEAIIKLKELGVKEFGIHSFIASNTVTNEYYPYIARMIFELILEVKEKVDVNFTFVNLSGGIGVPYKPEQEKNDIKKISEGVKKAYDELIKNNGLELAIYTELGPYMLAPYGNLIVKAIHEKHIYKEYIGVNSCAVDLMRPAMYGAYHHIVVLGKENMPCDHTYDIVGSLCENNDKFAIDRKLPKIEIGDRLAILDAGAHGQAMGYNYNGKLKCKELLLKQDGSVKLIRRAETLDDYFATLDFSEFK
jgi:diaminopimelate decarboxylase